MAASDNRRPSGGHTLFRYTAKDIDGRTVRGTMEATDYDALYAQLLVPKQKEITAYIRVPSCHR